MEKALRKYLPSGKFDNVSRKRSKAMSAVRGSGNKTTEVPFRLALVRNKIQGWKIRPKGITGNPDFIFLKKKIIVFVDGCFWHGCPKCGHVPKTNNSFWSKKLERNKTRDKKNGRILRKEGYKVLRFWEHDIKNNLAKCITRLKTGMKK